MSKAILNFKPDGSVEVQNEGGSAEKELKWLIANIGDVERRGHKHGASREEGLQLKQG